jgi:uncharacterized RDD family membrane protein YckC
MDPAETQTGGLPADREPTLPAAEIGRRIGAGILDGVGLLVCCVLVISGTMRLLGGSLPLLSVFCVVLLWSVVPLWAFRATLGMWLCDLEVVRKDGEEAEFFDLVLREMVGRGLFPAAYLATVLAGIVATWLGLTLFHMPMGLGLLLALGALFLLSLAAIGHLLVLLRADRIGLADLISGTRIVPKGAVPREDRSASLDADELAALGPGRRARSLPLVVAFEAGLLAVAVGIPYLASQGLPGSGADRAEARIERQQLDYAVRRFDANPTDATIAREAMRRLRQAGRGEEANEVWQRHQEARAETDRRREATLRARLEEEPTNFDALSRLVNDLLDGDRVDEAKEVYSAFVEAEGSGPIRAGYGIWLYRYGYEAEAADVLAEAADAHDAESARVRAYQGFALERVNRFEEAAVAFARALELDPDLHEVKRALEALAPILAGPEE